MFIVYKGCCFTGPSSLMANISANGGAFCSLFNKMHETKWSD